MLTGGLRAFACAVVTVFAVTSCQVDRAQERRIDLPPDLGGVDFLHLLEVNPEVLSDPDASDLKEILDIGKRNLDWLRAINAVRAPNQQLSLTSKARAVAYPIDKPNVYNKQIALTRYQALKSQLPKEISDVLYSSDTLPNASKLTDETHAEWSFKVDLVYQIAVRWLFVKRYIPELTQRRKADIRGYYYLTREPNIEAKLTAWEKLSDEQKQTYGAWLTDVCANTDTKKACEDELAKAENTKDGVLAYWNQYSPKSAEIWNSFFRIDSIRSDIHWTHENPDLATMPVLDPNNEAITSVLKENVEDEWKWPNATGTWQLQLNFQKGGSPNLMTHIEFVSGTTPHVVPPNKIVMNADQPTTEYEYRWALRHEYGHILGFPDCYLEFYDVDQKAVVNYQLDTTDLMCSRRGALKQNHFDEMKRVYYKGAP